MADLIFDRKSPWYNSYDSMMSRCYNPNSINYKNYGARGISVCEEWRHNPRAFGEWDELMEEARPEIEEMVKELKSHENHT